MTEESCEHLDFRAQVNVVRIAPDEEALANGDVTRFAADVTVKCEVCGQPFGFRAQDIGVLPDRPTVSASALELRVPLISPSELELDGPLARLANPGGAGFTVRRAEDLGEKLKAARRLARGLFEMIDEETWRASGGDDGQGHYEGDYRAEQIGQEIASWDTDG